MGVNPKLTYRTVTWPVGWDNTQIARLFYDLYKRLDGDEQSKIEKEFDLATMGRILDAISAQK